VAYNTITTPKGGQYQLVLADGSRIWLNAATSLRFPVAFPGKERRVELAGEGYFEVAHHADQPFDVVIAGMEVQVLGTHFNINSYADEESVKTTLLEGSVLVKAKNIKKEAVIMPGQQSILSANELTVDKNADVDEAVAWKNGLFQFSGADISTIMRQIGRWYNVEASFAGDARSIQISGKVSRNLNLSQIIEVLEQSGIEVKRNGDRLVARPKP
jgi:ferric-dicitrate binding protein FerR (iron transport regulator)